MIENKIKELQSKLLKTKDETFKKAIESKIKALKDNKAVLK